MGSVARIAISYKGFCLHLSNEAAGCKLNLERRCSIIKNAKRALLLGLVILFAVVSPVSAGCIYIPFPICSLDKDGKFSVDCNATKLTEHTLDANKHTYIFSNTCHGSDGTKVSNFTLRTISEWNSDGTVSQKMYNSSKPEISGTVKATCKYDPWIYDGPESGNPCTVTDRFFSVPSSGLQGIDQIASDRVIRGSVDAAFCTTCRSISEYQRQEFRNKLNSVMPTPGAPDIAVPGAPTTSYNLLSKIPVEIKHNPNYGLSWKFEYYSKTFKTWFASPVPAQPLLNMKTVAGVTTGDLNLVTTKDRLKWRFQVASAFPGAPWSEMREVTLYEITIQHNLPPKSPK